MLPQIRDAVRLSRSFLRRAVSFMVESGIRQFLDIGSGIPTVGSVHEVAQQADPECRVVYVDQEQIAVAQSVRLLQGNDRAVSIQGNLRDVDGILDHPETRRVLDLDQPVGLMMMLLLHFVPDSCKPVDILARYRDRLAPGSYLALSHVTADGDPVTLTDAARLYQDTATPLFLRSCGEVLPLFNGFDLVEPGVVDAALWRPSGSAGPSAVSMATVCYGGIGRKP